MKTPLKVGQKVYCQDRRSTEIKELTISRIGLYFFYTKELRNRAIDIQKLIHFVDSSDYSDYFFRVYLSKEEALESQEKEKLLIEIIKVLSRHNQQPYSLTQLRQIAEIIGINGGI